MTAMSDLAETRPSTMPQPLKRGDLRDALVGYARAETDAGRIACMSLRAAARDLGVSSGAVYRHFDDKDALLKAVAHQGFQEMRAEFIAIRPEGCAASSAALAAARAFSMGRAFVRFAHGNPALWRMMFGRIGLLCQADHRAEVGDMRYTILDCTQENIRDLYRLGAIPEPPTVEDTRFMWAAIHGAADLTQCRLQAGDCCLHEIADQTTDRSLRALGCDRAVIGDGRALADTVS
ncbi:TetR family transcriptional regulator [Rhodobacteraceae bacterium 2CG4]|uniref:TetR family transcriptional regulator n=1 Tax=Halovulum marinum TaxID=2662447 RepID=A0A6L5Z467_9RHOB|nr:TetR/AcrR family transcriptional regulator [Halovulum marinum]MSU91348.1 TetR family transcriptional regulator [Halovulum marinum]